MTDQELNGAADAIEPEVVLGADADDIVEQQDDTADERDWEAEAGEMGWVPEKDFRGPEGKWKDAKSFVEDGENVLPIVRSQNKRLREEIARERDDFAKRLAAIERTSKTAMERQKQAHETAMANLAKEMRKAAADGDVEKYDELEAQRDTLSKQAKEPEDDTAPEGKTPDEEFQARNDWYNVDDDLTVFAQGYSQRLISSNPNMSRPEMFAKVEAKVKEMFPSKFGGEPQRQRKSAANGHAAVDGGSDAPAAPNNKGNLVAKLPPEARAAGLRFVKDGTFKTLEEYAEVYHNE